MTIRVNSSGKLLLRNSLAAIVEGASIVAPDVPDEPTPVGPLALTDFAADMTPYQRIGTSKDIDVSGTCDAALTSVQVRAVDAVSLASVTAWKSLPASGGTFAGKLTVPQGDWRKLEASDGTNTARTTKRFGVGIIGLLIGQSNMENRPKTVRKDGGPHSPLSDKRSIEYHRTAGIRRMGNYNDALPANSLSNTTGYSSGVLYKGQPDTRGDGYVYVANLLAQSVGCIVCLVERAVGGSNIIDWVGAGQPANDHWGQAAAAVQAVGGDCEFALMYIGETNASTTTTTATMVSHYGTLMGRCHALTGRNASNFHLGVMSLGTGSYLNSAEGRFGAMRAAAVEFGNNTPGAFFAGAIHDSQTDSDNVHINGESHAKAGARNVACLKARYGLGPSGAGPRIIGAAWDGSGVVLTLQHTGGTALLDGAGGTGTALTGFDFKDAGGVLIAYTASAITSPTTIRFALPAKPATAAYAMTNSPHNVTPTDPKTALVPASCVYDNVPIQGSVVGCPIQPLAAITVTG